MDMTREFVIMPEFDRQWQKLGLDDSEERNAIAKMIIKLEHDLIKQEGIK